MATVITGITNNTNTDFKMLVPSYNTSRPNILINALTTHLNLATFYWQHIGQLNN